MRTPSSPLAALLILSIVSAPASAVGRAVVPRVSLSAGRAPVLQRPGFRPELNASLIGGAAVLTRGLETSLEPSLIGAVTARAPELALEPGVAHAPAAPVSLADIVEAAAPVAETDVVAGEAAADAAIPATALDSLRELAAPADGPRWVKPASFDGGSRRERGPAGDSVFVVNDEGVQINGRAADYYREVRRMVDLYKDELNLSESLDVMDDSYGDVWAKVTAVEKIAAAREFTHQNTHLEETLLWVDGVLSDGKRRIAVNTHRVYFHHAKNPQSEIAEGIRRVDGYLKEAEGHFRRGGKAEQALGRLDETVLVFDARGYQEIKDHLRMREKEMSARNGGRIKFQFLDEIATIPQGIEATRAELNTLVARHQGKGLAKIVEGVIYSRYVGLLLELKTMEHYHKLGYTILQGGRELFDAQGMYVSELDVVAKSPTGEVLLVEAKSSRVNLPPDEILADKVVRKLETYRRFKAQLDEMIGEPFTQVVFAVDVGRQPELIPFLKSKEKELSKRYGFPVSFLFLQSGPQNAGGAGAPGSGRGRRRR